MELVVVEQLFERSLSHSRLESALAADEWCRKLHGVEHVETFISVDGKRMVCIFRAPDADAVRAVARRMGYPYERIWTAVRI